MLPLWIDKWVKDTIQRTTKEKMVCFTKYLDLPGVRAIKI